MFALEGDYVSREDSAFVLPRSPTRVGGQIFRRWRLHVQAEVDAQTDGRVLPAGTVLATSLSGDGLIYHAGFHHPDVWLESSITTDLRPVTRSRDHERLRSAPTSSSAINGSATYCFARARVPGGLGGDR
jgi:hypothetical protein